MFRMAQSSIVTLAATIVAVCPAWGEITSFTGYAEARLQEFVNGVERDSTISAQSFPATQSELPLQVVAAFLNEDQPEPAAAAVASQFADPRELDQANPEEFAINLTLNSISADVRYTARAVSQETRGVLFSPGEIAGTQDGQTVELLGRLFLDGALVIVARDTGRDLRGAQVRLRVTVEQITDGTSQTVFFGEVSLNGDVGGGATVSAEGAFPTDDLIFSDLGELNLEFGVFRLLVIPPIDIDYEFSSVVGQPTTLRATVQVEAANIEDHVGVAAVIGTPTGTITDVISFTQGLDAAQKFLSAVQSERANPTGTPAFAPPPQPVFPLFGFLCGPLGLVSLLGCVAACVAPRVALRTGWIS